MSKRKKESKELTFYDFRNAVIVNQPMANEMIRDDRGWLKATSSTGETALHDLTIENHLDGVKWLIAHGADVNAPDHSGATTLLHAAQLGYLEIAALLLENGADINAEDENYERTALAFAACSGYVEICELLIKSGAPMRDPAALIDSAPRRKQEALAALLKRFGYLSDTDIQQS